MLPGGNIGGNGILHTGRHLAGNKAFPYQLIQLILVAGKALLDLGGRQVYHGRADGLVAVLRVGFGAEGPGLRQRVVFPIGPLNVIMRRRKCLIGDAQRIGSHIGDQAHRTQVWQVDALVQLLRHLHGTLGLEAKPSGGILLQSGGDKGRRGVLLPRAHLYTLYDKRLFFGGGL